MNLLRWAGAIALALLAMPAASQTLVPQCRNAAGAYIPCVPVVPVDKTGTAIDAANPLPVTVVLPQVTATSRSGIFGTTATQLMPANPSRRFIQVQVQNSATCYISGLSAATADQNSLLLPGGGQLFESSTHVTSGAISIICSAASTPVYAREG